ncbi:MAG: bifunctional histidinol-phosphatase/imidazoleglycerol-phosphate dehydratase HisB [Bacteroidales bacterium]|nr:bifunctional histidinol-phosphatase/imidazoleglycerol-phosphate dehydratase HisB [Bacteroidales bacterium]
MKKVIFLDRDGTLIHEPAEDFQVDSLEKLEFIPKVFRNLYYIRRYLDYELVIVTNQDGLGTPSFPIEKYETVQHKMLKCFENENIVFDDILVDKSFPGDNSPGRKPQTGLLRKYMNKHKYDLSGSFVIGDRLTDIRLAKNLGAKAIFFAPVSSIDILTREGLEDQCVLVSDDWDAIYAYISEGDRTASVRRKTGETDVSVKLVINGTGKSDISTGLGFFDHMLEQIARHSDTDITIQVKGDLNVDEHHTIEDTALALGEAFFKALGDKKGIERYGFVLPMDDCLAQVVIDFSGRSWLVWDADFKRERIGDMPAEMFMHFFKSFSDTARCNLNIKAEGKNEHHKIEAIFKALGRAIKMAVRKDIFNFNLPSTKGSL